MACHTTTAVQKTFNHSLELAKRCLPGGKASPICWNKYHARRSCQYGCILIL